MFYHVAADLAYPKDIQGLLIWATENLITEVLNKVLLATDNKGRLSVMWQQSPVEMRKFREY